MVVTQQREHRAVQADLALQNKVLIAALAAKPVRVQRDKQLESEMDLIRQAMQPLDLQNKRDATGAADPKAAAYAATEKRLHKLAARKKELETAPSPGGQQVRGQAAL